MLKSLESNVNEGKTPKRKTKTKKNSAKRKGLKMKGKQSLVGIDRQIRQLLRRRAGLIRREGQARLREQRKLERSLA